MPSVPPDRPVFHNRVDHRLEAGLQALRDWSLIYLSAAIRIPDFIGNPQLPETFGRVARSHSLSKNFRDKSALELGP
jgi:hypothetical protein